LPTSTAAEEDESEGGDEDPEGNATALPEDEDSVDSEDLTVTDRLEEGHEEAEEGNPSGR
jgi:hypothetical protein